MVRLLLSLVFVLVGMVGTMALVGMFVPRRHVARRRARFRASPDTLWSVMTTFEAVPSWRSDVKKIELLPPIDGHTQYVEHSRHGAITYVVDEQQPSQRLVTRIASKNLPFTGRWTYVLTEDRGSTVLTITEDGSVNNPVFRFMLRYLLSEFATMDAYLQALATRVGEAVKPESAARTRWG